jgi:hypothetical protein
VKITQIVHDTTSIGFTAGILLIVLMPVLMATGTAQKVIPFFSSDTASKNSFSANPPYTPPKSTHESIPSGAYAGWTQYHNLELGFSANIPAGMQADELPQTRAEKPRYPEFMLQYSYNQGGIDMEFARITVYDSTFAVNTKAQEASTDQLFASTPTKQEGKLAGHTSVQYFYTGSTRTVVYLIDDGSKTFEIRGSIDSTDAAAVEAYWKTFNQLLNSFAID